MVRNYLKIALRNLFKYKSYSLINLLGLVLGVSCCLIILLYIRFELSYDRHHEKSDQIYRLVSERKIGESLEEIANVPFPAGPEIALSHPEIEASTRLFRATNGASVSVGEEMFAEDLFFFSDSNIFDVFNFDFVAGNPAVALDKSHKVVITQRVVDRYFAHSNPIGQTIRARLVGQSGELIVSGVVENPPENSHLQFDFLVPFDSDLNRWNAGNPRWDSNMLGAWTYFLLSQGSDPEALERKFPAFVELHVPASVQNNISFSLQPLTSIHLHSHLLAELGSNSNIIYIYIFSVIAVLVLIIAYVNFITLSTAYAVRRAQEIGMRKVLGAYRGQLIIQFLGEAFLFSFIAILFAIGCTKVVLPYFSAVTGKPLALDLADDISMLFMLAGLWGLTGLLSGIYPAFFLSNFKPIKALKGKSRAFHSGSLSLRGGMIVMQFSISIILLIAFQTIFDQLDYIRNKGLGFQQEQLVVITGRNDASFESFQYELKKDPGILAVTVTSRVPGGRHLASGLFRPDGSTPATRSRAQFLKVQKDFLTTFRFDLVYGRDFSGVDDGAILLNETAAKQFGWQNDAVGKTVTQFVKGVEETKQVIGVIKDVHFESMYTEVKPLVLTGGINDGSRIIVRISPNDIPGALTHIKNAWNLLNPESSVDYYFLDEDIHRFYQEEERMSSVLRSFTMLAIFVTCIGLFGLVSFLSEQRTKEIGIRKVMGAPVSRIVFMLSGQFVRLILVAMLISMPIAYIVVNMWLQNFAYRVEISAWTFISAAGLTLLLAVITIASRTVKTAMVNPVSTLQHD